jgi:hypothetical protein
MAITSKPFLIQNRTNSGTLWRALGLPKMGEVL